MIQVHILLENKDFNITEMVSTLTISQTLTSVCSTANVDINMGIYTKNFPDLYIPAYTPLWIKDVNNDGSLKMGLFSGIIVDFTKNNLSFNCTCYDYAYYLQKSTISKDSNGLTAEDGTRKILEELGLKEKYLYPTQILINKLVLQKNAYDTIMGMYTDVHKQTGEIFFLMASYMNEIGVYKANLVQSKNIIQANDGIDNNVSNGNLLSLEYKEDGLNVINKVNVYDENNKLIDTLTNDYGQEFYGILQSEYSQEEGKDYKTVVNKTILHSIDKDITVEVLGDYDYWIGNRIKIYVPWIKDLDKKEDGTYSTGYITSHAHTWNCATNSYTTKLSISLWEVMDEKELTDDKEQSKSSGKGGMVEKAVKWAESKANNKNVTYEWGAWGEDKYDCSHFVICAYEQAGIPMKTNGATYTGDMKSVALSLGFEDVTSSCDLSTGEGMVRGDILLLESGENGHTALYCGNGQMVDARTANAPKEDQVLIHNYNNHPWNVILRYPEKLDTSSGEDINGWSGEFISWVESWEGFIDHWYDDDGGTQTIGIGTAVTSDLGKNLKENGITSCTEDEAIQWMLEEMNSWWQEISSRGGSSLDTNYQYFLCDYAYQNGYTNLNRFVNLLLSGDIDSVCKALGNDKRSKARKQLLKNGVYQLNT